MKRRTFLHALASFPLALYGRQLACAADAANKLGTPVESGLPPEHEWAALKEQLHGRLFAIKDPLSEYKGQEQQLNRDLENPYFIGDSPVFTQTSGWIDAWDAQPSAYAVAAESADDVAAALNFARKHKVRLVVRGGAHSYNGQSNAKNSLMVWTRKMRDIQIDDSFVPAGAPAECKAQPAVTVGAGNIWLDVYEAVVTNAGRYVQGGGCATVGVAGFLQGGGFGSFSKHYGLAAARLLQAEVVTADGVIKTVNKYSDPELFWALKGGSGASFAVITKLTLATSELPETNGAVRATVQAKSDAAFQELIDKLLQFYSEKLFNHHWGEAITLRKNNSVDIAMVCYALNTEQASAIWKPFFDFVREQPGKFAMPAPEKIYDMPARYWWNVKYRQEHFPHSVVMDSRTNSKLNHAWFLGDGEQVGAFLYGYESVWLPQRLLSNAERGNLAKIMYDATRHYDVSLHFNKALAGAPPEALEAAADTAINPAVIDAFTLVIIAGGEPHAYKMLGQKPNVEKARVEAKQIKDAIAEFRKLVPDGAAYALEAGYDQPGWQQAYWGSNYPRLAALKTKYDPEGLFRFHHGIGFDKV